MIDFEHLFSKHSPFNYLNLEFKDEALEHEFQNQKRKNLKGPISLYYVVGILLYFKFGIIDFLIYEHSYEKILLIKVGLVGLYLFLVLIYYLSYREQFPQKAYVINLMESLFMGISTYLITYYAANDDIAKNNYPFYIIMGFLWIQPFMLNFRQVIFLSFIHLGILNLILNNIFGYTDIDFYININFILIVIFGICINNLYLRELLNRKNFYLNRKLLEANLKLEEKVQSRSNELEKERTRTINALIEGQELERARIGRDLHDELGSKMVSLQHQLEITSLASPLQKQRYVNSATRLVQEIYTSLREITKKMLPYTLNKLGFLPAVLSLVDEFKKLNKNLEVEIKIEDELYTWKFPPDTVLHFYRLIQELLTNVDKHAHATHVKLFLVLDEKYFHIHFEDNGVGFDVDSVQQGFGLKNIKHRVRILNGILQIESVLGYGTLINIKFPRPISNVNIKTFETDGLPIENIISQ